MKLSENSQKALILMFLAALITLGSDYLYMPMFPQPKLASSEDRAYGGSEIADYETGKKIMEGRQSGFTGASIDLPQPEPIKNNAESVAKMIQHPASLNIDKNILPPPVPNHVGGDKVVIIIDDMGMDKKRSWEAVNLPGPLTLSFLPYAPQLAEITKAAMAKGHQLIIHVPMAPLDSRLDPGPLALRDGMYKEDFEAALDHMFASFSGYVGINNHMGSKLTQEEEPMKWVMARLAERNLLFVDSKTIAASVAERVAAEYGLAHTSRDVFLDNEDKIESVKKSLEELEATAHRRGYAVAIGHPKDSTIAALKEWIPELKDKGLTLAPVSAVVRKTAAISTVSSPP